MDSERLLDRFLQYVRIDTTADPASGEYPSSEGQWQLGQLIVDQLQVLGLHAVRQDEHGLIWATVPATGGCTGPVVALNAHLDTSPDAPGGNVQPRVIRDYDGGDLLLPATGQFLRTAENPALKALRGKTIVTSDGTTLLGADDKAGVAVIVETAAWLVEHPEIAHGPIRLLFTCDEEIGRGVQHVDLARLAADVCYTLDGEGSGRVDVETFSADLATVTIRGVNIHPAVAKGRMVNAVRLAAHFLDLLPRDRLAPEATEGREGFLHPYQIEGTVSQAAFQLLLRDFDTARLADHAQLLHSIGSEVQAAAPGAEVQVTVTPQYRNLADGLKRDPRSVAYARRALERLGRACSETVVRGGTDGALLTAQGLPTPNLSTGQHNPHSPLEWACLDEMVEAAEMLVELVQVWAREAAGG